ncbi:MAG: hypothetical protein ACI9OJ_002418 [Myxococcota bacterium]|jgi:hypothetical protein
MDPMEQVFDFFKRLVRGRIDSVEIAARAKAKNVEYKAKSKAASAFNGAVDGAVGKAKDKATGATASKSGESKPSGEEAD